MKHLKCFNENSPDKSFKENENLKYKMKKTILYFKLIKIFKNYSEIPRIFSIILIIFMIYKTTNVLIFLFFIFL